MRLTSSSTSYQRRLALPTREQDNELPLASGSGVGELPLEWFELEADPLREGGEAEHPI